MSSWPQELFEAKMKDVKAYVALNRLTKEQEQSLLDERRKYQYRKSSKKKPTLGQLQEQLSTAKMEKEQLLHKMILLQTQIEKEKELFRANPAADPEALKLLVPQYSDAKPSNIPVSAPTQ
eukprot:m.310093 g.310093  ORF g.310093 m.310093 type:complete len:121 (-) comp15948_c0_seq9:218-580(-)